jgi:hypothetical protein
VSISVATDKPGFPRRIPPQTKIAMSFIFILNKRIKIIQLVAENVDPLNAELNYLVIFCDGF